MYHDLARELRKSMTEAERKLWGRLRGKQFGGFKFREQSPIGRFIVDFVRFDRKVVVELDGDQHARSVEGDNARTQWLKSQGFRVLRFWKHDVLENLDTVMEAIWLALQMPPALALPHEEEPPTLTLPHKWGGDSEVGWFVDQERPR
jgi:very-short-patch-repair endonuclease